MYALFAESYGSLNYTKLWVSANGVLGRAKKTNAYGFVKERETLLLAYGWI